VDAGEPVVEDPAREKIVGHLPDDGAPQAIRAGKALVESASTVISGRGGPDR